MRRSGKAAEVLFAVVKPHIPNDRGLHKGGATPPIIGNSYGAN
jgi:hypothetical protein